MMVGVNNLPNWWRADALEFAQRCFSWARCVTGVNEHGFSIADYDTHKGLHLLGVRVRWQIPNALANLSKRPVHTLIIADDSETKAAYVQGVRTSREERLGSVALHELADDAYTYLKLLNKFSAATPEAKDTCCELELDVDMAVTTPLRSSGEHQRAF